MHSSADGTHLWNYILHCFNIYYFLPSAIVFSLIKFSITASSKGLNLLLSSNSINIYFYQNRYVWILFYIINSKLGRSRWLWSEILFSVMTSNIFFVTCVFSYFFKYKCGSISCNIFRVYIAVHHQAF